MKVNLSPSKRMAKKPPSKVNLERGQRVAHVRDLMGLSQEELSELLGLSRGAVGNWELGGGAHIDNLSKLAKVSGVPLNWIYSNEGDKPQSVKARPNLEAKMPAADGSPQRVVVAGRPYEGSQPYALPDIDTTAGAGAGGVAIDTDTNVPMLHGDLVRGEIVLPPYLLSEYTSTAPGFVHVVRVKGDSMEPSLESGDRVFVDTRDRGIGQGGIFVIWDKRIEEVLVKRLQRSYEGKKLTIEIASDNPKEGAPKPADPRDIVVIGRAVGRLTRL